MTSKENQSYAWLKVVDALKEAPHWDESGGKWMLSYKRTGEGLFVFASSTREGLLIQAIYRDFSLVPKWLRILVTDDTKEALQIVRDLGTLSYPLTFPN